jgi:tRNA A-37 threonylcarbamoyl transferase component Bud32
MNKYQGALSPLSFPKMSTSSLPHHIRVVLDIITNNLDVDLEIICNNADHYRYILKLGGNWQNVLFRCATMNSESDDDDDLDFFIDFEDKPSVCIKLQNAEYADDDEDVCHKIISLKCPGISARFIQSVTILGVRITFMEYLDGCSTLRSLSKSKSPLLTRAFYKKTKAVVRSMWEDAAIIHCDLHLDNILVSPAGRIFLIDFGMSMVLDNKMHTNLITAVKKTAMGSAFNTVCKDFALSTIMKRGYDLTPGSQWNDDVSGLAAIRRACINRPQAPNPPSPSKPYKPSSAVIRGGTRLQ